MKYNKKWFWLFVLPVLAAFTLIVRIPSLTGIYYSFTDCYGTDDQVPQFVGLKNYMLVLKDEGFKNAFIFTTKFTLVSIVIVNVVGFSLALLVTRKLKMSNFMRTIFFMPNLIGGLILGFIWQFIFVGVFQTHF